MSTVSIVLLIILIILTAGLIVLYFYGKKLEKKQHESEALMEAQKQTVQMLILDKKMLPLKDSGLPQAAIDQAPKLARRQKVPVVMVRVQGRVMTMLADNKIFPVIPVKREVKATISGIYITDVKAIRGQLEKPPVKEKWYKRFLPAKKEKENTPAPKEKKQKTTPKEQAPAQAKPSPAPRKVETPTPTPEPKKPAQPQKSGPRAQTKARKKPARKKGGRK